MDIEKFTKIWMGLVVLWVLFVMGAIAVALFLLAKFLKVI